jgi:hypothetical protein
MALSQADPAASENLVVDRTVANSMLHLGLEKIFFIIRLKRALASFWFRIRRRVRRILELELGIRQNST